ATDWYPWSIYVSAFPESGAPAGAVYTVYLENTENAPEKLIFYPESQCLVYMRYDAQEPANPVEHLRMRPENPAFFEMADPLLQDGIYPFAPTTMEADFSVTVSGHTTPLSQEMSQAVAEQFSKMQWKPTDAMPQDSYTLTLECKDAFWDSTFVFSPDTQVIEWKQGETVLECFALDPKDLDAIEQILDGKEVGQPFMPLELSSALTTFRCVEVDGRGKLFGVQLPENNTVFTADLFEVQKTLDTLRWEPVELPVENWRPGYIEMNCMGGTMLFSMSAYDDDGHWLLRWNGSDGTVRQYFADEAFMASLVKTLAETAQTAQVDSRLTDFEIASAARDYLQSVYPALSESVYSAITEVTSLPQDATILSDTPALAPLYEISFYEPEENADTNQPPVISLYLIKQGTGYAVIAERMPDSAGTAEWIATET
ncbi:MAG: hypothetical protein IKN55_02035, partial [Oscillospiraceae bacterium]|nr:hypothetical protein [Oscillospiraceae bacterium]